MKIKMHNLAKVRDEFPQERSYGRLPQLNKFHRRRNGQPRGNTVPALVHHLSDKHDALIRADRALRGSA